MMNIDIAKRVYDRTWKLDPIVRSLLDTDFYKLLMLQPIHARHETVMTRFSAMTRRPIRQIRSRPTPAATIPRRNRGRRMTRCPWAAMRPRPMAGTRLAVPFRAKTTLRRMKIPMATIPTGPAAR